ncbi:hypothetical protein TGAMA5MH_09405 [Trichoderma gamsii]|uniref:Uncharacterized protein n=1 Tax=Trichoderma gamsii TaxID=398673 RepID=A0A2K0SZJ3_9HYPO|nr:hypothetical protein TGAMA5MH_09405 [Trichoderma gamsii]
MIVVVRLEHPIMFRNLSLINPALDTPDSNYNR